MQLLDFPDTHTLLERTPVAFFVNCRSEMEHLFAGHPADAHRVSWNDGPHWKVNPELVSTACKLTGHGIERPAMPICRSGNRSAAMVHVLEEVGFRDVYVVRHGFKGDLDSTHHRNMLSGWRHAGLPREQC